MIKTTQTDESCDDDEEVDGPTLHPVVTMQTVELPVELTGYQEIDE